MRFGVIALSVAVLGLSSFAAADVIAPATSINGVSQYQLSRQWYTWAYSLPGSNHPFNS